MASPDDELSAVADALVSVRTAVHELALLVERRQPGAFAFSLAKALRSALALLATNAVTVAEYLAPEDPHDALVELAYGQSEDGHDEHDEIEEALSAAPVLGDSMTLEELARIEQAASKLSAMTEQGLWPGAPTTGRAVHDFGQEVWEKVAELRARITDSRD